MSVLAILAVLNLLNPKFIHQADNWQFIHLEKSIMWLPGSIDAAATFPVAVHHAALAAAFLVLLDLGRKRNARWLILKGLALSGFIIALIGIFQKSSNADSMLWVAPERSGEVFFAAFRYHANAASFLNLSWPAALAVWLRARQKPQREIISSLWFLVFFLIVIAIFVNTSKAGQVLGMLGLAIAIIGFRHLFTSANRSRAVMIISLTLCLCVMALAILPSLSTTVGKWDEAIADGGSLKGRLLAYQTCLYVLPDSGFFGTGPGTFRLIFPYYTSQLQEDFPGFWYHAHQDYLQTMIEWGFLGALAWIFIFGEALRKGSYKIIESRRNQTLEFSTRCALIALFIVCLHAMVDFPFQIPSIQLQIAAYTAILWNAKTSSYREKSSGKSIR